MRKIIVQKYGGTSLATVAAIRRVARRVIETKRRGALDDEEIIVLKSFSGRESFTFIIPTPDVERGVGTLHKALVEDRADSSVRVLRRARG
jgi:hypothetical protein